MYQPSVTTVPPRAELGPQSWLWRYAGDTRIAFLGGTIGMLQTMHPAIGAALIDHSNFFDYPADRVFRSLPAILGTVYDGPEAPNTGRAVRGFHRRVKGVDANGNRYHALDPSTFWWAHATFQYMVEQVIDRFDQHRLTDAERDQLYEEGLIWFERYGVSDRSVPENRAAFQVEWDRYCEEVLVPNPASDWLIETVLAKPMPKMGEVPNLPHWARQVLDTRPVRYLLQPGLRITTFGGLPPIVRQRFGIPWSRTDQLRLQTIEATIRHGWGLVPPGLRWQPRARQGWRRLRDENRTG